jgi:predicted Zn-dependent peptidase
MYNIFKLNNGLRVVIEKIDYVNSVSVGLWVENGSRNENRINNGISHFIEHMFFKGTENRTAKKIAEDIEDVGGQINAFTGKEATCFYIKALDSHLELSLEVLADMLFNSRFSEEDIEKEKGVVIDEINMSEDSPEDVLSDLHSEAAWGADSISLPILGTEETVKSFNRKQLKDYVSSYYIPENSVISICGNFDLGKIQSYIERYFGKWDTNNKKVTHYTSPHIINNTLYRNKNIEQMHISLGMQGIQLGNDDIYTLLLLNNILGGGVSSRLFQKVREENGLCYSIYSYIASFNNTGLISVYTSLNPNYAVEALKLIKSEIHAFTQEGIKEEKLKKAKEQIKGSYILGLESTSSRMFSYGKSVLFLGRINDPQEVMNKIDSIDQNKIQRVMEMTFKKGILNSAFVGEKVDINSYNAVLENSTFAFDSGQKVSI